MLLARLSQPQGLILVVYDSCAPCGRHLCEQLQENCRPLLVSMVDLTQRVKEWVDVAENLTNKWCAVRLRRPDVQGVQALWTRIVGSWRSPSLARRDEPHMARLACMSRS